MINLPTQKIMLSQFLTALATDSNFHRDFLLAREALARTYLSDFDAEALLSGDEQRLYGALAGAPPTAVTTINADSTSTASATNTGALSAETNSDEVQLTTAPGSTVACGETSTKSALDASLIGSVLLSNHFPGAE
ncbi:MAG: hypothetical protein AAF756_11710 [Pseudomonadota bacterium]